MQDENVLTMIVCVCVIITCAVIICVAITLNQALQLPLYKASNLSVSLSDEKLQCSQMG